MDFRDRGEALNDLFRHFKRETGIPIGTLAAALRFRDDTGDAHLARPAVARQLADLVDPATLGQAAARLGLCRKDHACLRDFSRGVRQLVRPHELPAPCEDLEEGIQGAEAGDLLTDQGRWELALPHLEFGWEGLRRQAWRSPATFHQMVRAGTQLASLRDYQGRHGESAAMMAEVARAAACADLAGDHRRSRKAVALAYKGAAVSFRHAGRTRPARVLEAGQRCVDLLRETGLDPVGLAGALRDQAKPWTAAALGSGMPGASAAACQEHAMGVLGEARRVLEGLGGEHVARDLGFTWAETAAAHACFGRPDEAERAWDRSQALSGLSWSADRRMGSPLGTKLALVRMAIFAARGKWDDLLDLHQAMAGCLDAAVFAERLARADELAAAARAAEFGQVCRAMLR